MLGPLFFLIYINDLLVTITNKCDIEVYAFVDDIKSLENSYTDLQNALDIVATWTCT